MNRCLLWAAWISLIGGLVAAGGAAEPEPDGELISMIAELVREEDRDMRGLGLQQIREAVPGEAATRRFAALLPSLSADGQAALLQALGDRGDAAARGAVVQMLGSSQQVVRAAALEALGSLGGPEDVVLLARRAAGGSPLEQQAAASSLVRLPGREATEAIVAACDGAEPAIRASLLAALGRRHAREALPTVLAGARADEPVVQLAALDALRLLAEGEDAGELVELVKSAATETVRGKAQLALFAACQRGREACAPAVIEGLNDTRHDAQCALLPALARAGGSAALETLIRFTAEADQPVRDEAVRLLSTWDDPAVAPQLRELAGSQRNSRHQVLAFHGLIRLADARGDRPADTRQLLQLMPLAQRPDEQRLVLAALGRATDAQALAAAVPLLEDPRLRDEAALAVTAIARTLGSDVPAARQALERVLKTSRNAHAREQAQQALAAP